MPTNVRCALNCGSRSVLFFAFCTFFGAAIRSADDPGALLKRTYESAKSALAAGDIVQAELGFKQTVALGLRQLGSLSIAEARYDEATRELDEALKVEPDNPDIATDAAIAWFHVGEIKKAQQLARSVVAANPRNARAQNVLGRIDLYRADFPAAVTDLQAAVALDEDFETSYFLGIAYLKAKRTADARQWFQHLQEKMGDSAALHVLIGRAYSISHLPEPAVAEFRKAIELDPKYPRAHALLGYSILELRFEEGYPQARIEFERELTVHPDDYNSLLLLGISTVALRDYSAAEAALLHASRLRPKEAFAYLYLGETYTETKRLAQAVEVLEKYLRLVPDPQAVPRDVSRAYYLLGQDLRRLGRVEEAQKALANSQRYREATSPKALTTAIAAILTASPVCSNREARTRRNPQKRWRREACGKVPPFSRKQQFHKPRNPRPRARITSSHRKFLPAHTTTWALCARKMGNLPKPPNFLNKPPRGTLACLAWIATGVLPASKRSNIAKPLHRSNDALLHIRMTRLFGSSWD